MKKLLAIALLASVGCAHSFVKDAYNLEASLAAFYKVAAPMRAELCKSQPAVVPQASCDASLKALKADYVLLQSYSDLLEKYANTKDAGLARQIEALTPSVRNAVLEIQKLINQWKGLNG